jgi:restriction system protein
VLITTSKFSKDALEYVNKIERRIVLIDGQRLAELMIDFGVGVTTTRQYALKRIDSDYFDEDLEGAAP